MRRHVPVPWMALLQSRLTRATCSGRAARRLSIRSRTLWHDGFAPLSRLTTTLTNLSASSRDGSTLDIHRMSVLLSPCLLCCTCIHGYDFPLWRVCLSLTEHLCCVLVSRQSSSDQSCGRHRPRAGHQRVPPWTCQSLWDLCVWKCQSGTGKFKLHYILNGS